MSVELVSVAAGAPIRPGILRLEVVTPTGIAVRADVDEVEAPSVDGEFGVLPGHVPLLAALRAGVVTFRSAGRTVVVAVGPGFADTRPDRLSILTDRCIEAGDVSLSIARQGLEAAQRKMDEFPGLHEGNDFDDIAHARDWAQAQIDAARAVGRT